MSELHVDLSDSLVHGRVVPEVTHFHLNHKPGEPDKINGLSFVVRIGDRSFSVMVSEGVVDYGMAPVPAEAVENGSPIFLEFIEAQHEELAELQLDVLATAPKVMQIFDDIRARIARTNQ